MSLYTNTSDVASELGGVTIDNSSTPSATVVLSWIADASKEIEELTGRVWASTTVSSASGYEYHDYDGSGRVRFKNVPVISVQGVEYEENGVGSATSSWVALTEGRTFSQHYIVYKDEGLVVFHSNTDGYLPTKGQQNVRITYTYGYIVTPRHIKRLCTLMVAKRYISTVAHKTASSEGGSVSVGSISVSDPNNYVDNHLSGINKELEMLLREVATRFKTRIYDITEYD